MAALAHLEGKHPALTDNVKRLVQGESVDDAHRDAAGPQQGRGQMAEILAVAPARVQGIQGVVTPGGVDVSEMIHHPDDLPLHRVELCPYPPGIAFCKFPYPGMIGLDLGRGLQVVLHGGGHGLQGKGVGRFEDIQPGLVSGRERDAHVEPSRRPPPAGSNNIVAPRVP